MKHGALTLMTLAVLTAPQGASAADSSAARGLTAVEGIKVGHFTLAERPTGCTVILTEGGAVGGVDVHLNHLLQIVCQFRQWRHEILIFG